MRAGKAVWWQVGLGLSKIDNLKALSREEFLSYVILEDWRILKYKSLPELLYFKTRYRQAPCLFFREASGGQAGIHLTILLIPCLQKVSIPNLKIDFTSQMLNV